jgi:hypothetical protein
MDAKAAPRIYCIPAAEAPVVAVFRRGPSDWCHVGLWDLAGGRYEPGAWLHGRIFPRRSDLSPDGRFLCYFAHKPGSSWEHGEAYVALSKLPWLTALHAFGTCGTWTRGYAFSEEGSGDEFEGVSLPIPYGLRSVPALQFASERRRGWQEAPDCPPRDPDDAWDQHRNARMQRRQPGGSRVLCLESLGWAGGEFGVEQSVDGMKVRYTLESERGVEHLDELQWADWSHEGKLLTATRSGRLQVSSPGASGLEILFEEDLSVLEPSPTPPPDWAGRWAT